MEQEGDGVGTRTGEGWQREEKGVTGGGDGRSVCYGIGDWGREIGKRDRKG